MFDALTVVTTTTDQLTHFHASSPRLRGTAPLDTRRRMPASTLCGVPVHGVSGQPLADVGCTQCLLLSPKYWTLPGFKVGPARP